MARRENYQFDYPETGWSTGNMRMATRRRQGPSGKEFQELEGIRKEREDRISQKTGYPELSKEEFGEWMTNRPRGANTFGKDSPYMPDMSDTSEGFMMHKDHPQLKDIQDNFDIFNVPGGKGDFLFLKDKKDQSKWEVA